MTDGDNLLGEHLEDVADELQRSPRPHAHRAQSALEGGADLALHEIISTAITAYITSRKTPTMTHSMKIASPRGMNEVSSPWTQEVTILKSNMAYFHFLR